MYRTRLTLSLVFVLALAVLLTGCPGGDGYDDGGGHTSTPPPSSPYQHVQFEQGLSAAEIQEKYPLTDEGRNELTPENVEQLAQWQVDQLYARLDGQAIPKGPWQGRFFFAEGSGVTDIAQVFSGLPGRIAEKIVNVKLEKINRLGEALWKGKVFFKEQGVLRNMIDHEAILGDIFDVDPSQVRKEEIDGREVALLFPAKLYCGESLMDSRRESVIIDYADSASIEGYIPEIDYLAAKDALNIRDEIRFVKPGFYLGLAYFLDGKLLLTFTLQNADAAAAGVPAQECSTGESATAESSEADAS